MRFRSGREITAKMRSSQQAMAMPVSSEPRAPEALLLRIEAAQAKGSLPKFQSFCAFGLSLGPGSIGDFADSLSKIPLLLNFVPPLHPSLLLTAGKHLQPWPGTTSLDQRVRGIGFT